MTPQDRIIVAADVRSAKDFWALVEPLMHEADLRWVKIGSVLFAAEGPSLVREASLQGLSVFLDLKLHDIPHQVGLTVAQLAELGARLTTVHTAGGERMLEAAVEAAGPTMGILGVTVLTSHDSSSLAATGVDLELTDAVEKRAALAMRAGLAGLVCSPLEASQVRRTVGEGPDIVTPGIRLKRPDGADDQRRVATPRDALRAGATRLVVGRPITQAPSPVEAFNTIADMVGR